MFLLGGHMFVSFLHVVLPLLGFFAQMIKFLAQFPNYPIKTIRLDKASEFTSQTFINYCMLVGINIEHPVAHTHT